VKVATLKSKAGVIPDARNYFLDTNCFYCRSGAELASLVQDGSSITTTSLAPLEIACCIHADEFQRRKKAMRALRDSGVVIHPQDGDIAVKMAFGLASVHLETSIPYRRFIDAMCSSMGCSEYQKKVNVFELELWKDSQGIRFSNLIAEGDRGAKAEMEKHNPTLPRAKRRAELGRWYTGSEAHSLNVLALAERAGFLTRNELDKYIFKKSSRKIAKRALRAYTVNRSRLDFYLRLMQRFRLRKLEHGGAPEKNALWDCEFFLFMQPNNANQIFVTKEDFWVDLISEIAPTRVLHIDSLLPRTPLPLS
jgi:hypothetical protein